MGTPRVATKTDRSIDNIEKVVDSEEPMCCDDDEQFARMSVLDMNIKVEVINN